MQRWHLMTGLAGAAVLAALVVPELQLVSGTAPSTPPPTPASPEMPATPEVPDLSEGILTLSADLDQGALLQGAGDDRYLVIEVSAPELPGDVRRPVHVSVVMDVSGSMAGRGKIDHARTAAAELAGLMGPEDSFSLVTFSDRANVRVPLGGITDAGLRLIRSIEPGGGTNLYDGLQQGLDELDAPDLAGVKRVVLLSDGIANIGVTDPDTLARTAGSQVRDGISVSALGLGLDYNEDLLAAMSDAGGGKYRFVDRPGLLSDMFAEELKQMTAVAGREVSVDVDLPAGVKLQEVYGYDHDSTSDGYRVFIGDVHGGETRKIVARVQVDTPSLGDMDIAEVELSYADAESGEHQGALAEVDATVTPDTRVAQASAKPKVQKKAVRARAGKLLDDGARDWEKGDLASNQAKLEEASGLLAALGYVSEADEVEEQRNAYGDASPASDEGLFQVKRSKEAARGYAY